MKTYRDWDDAYLQHRLTEVEDDDRMEEIVNRAISCIVVALLISVGVIAWLIYRCFTT